MGLPQPWPQGERMAAFTWCVVPPTGVLCCTVGVFLPLLEVLPTRPWKAFLSSAGFCPELIYWLVVSLFDHSRKPVFCLLFTGI